jgi:hypothetical protein
MPWSEPHAGMPMNKFNEKCHAAKAAWHFQMAARILPASRH